jgi:hypothetical protein
MLNIKNMRTIKIPTVSRNKFTFFEAAEICKPFLQEKDFLRFLHEVGLLTNHGIPNREFIWDVFYPEFFNTKQLATRNSTVDFFITRRGLITIIRKAMNYYLKNRQNL